MQQPVGETTGSGVMSKGSLGVISAVTPVTVQERIMEAILQLGMNRYVGVQSQVQSKIHMGKSHRWQVMNKRGRANRMS